METRIRETILELFRHKDILKDVGEDDNFFEAGVSSLTIVELQIRVEEVLKISVPTSRLMRLSTINGWIEAYVESSSTHAHAAEVT